MPTQIKGGSAASKPPAADGDDDDEAAAAPAAGAEGALWWPSNDALTKRILQLRGLIQKAIDQLQPKQEPKPQSVSIPAAAAPSSQTAVARTATAEAASPVGVKEAPAAVAKAKDLPGKERVSVFHSKYRFLCKPLRDREVLVFKVGALRLHVLIFDSNKQTCMLT